MNNKNNKHTKNSLNKKLTPFIAPGSETNVTKKEIEMRKRRIEQAEEIGQRITRVDNKDEGYENPYRAKALCYILKDKEVPEELKIKIAEFDKKHKQLSKYEDEINKRN